MNSYQKNKRTLVVNSLTCKPLTWWLEHVTDFINFSGIVCKPTNHEFVHKTFQDGTPCFSGISVLNVSSSLVFLALLLGKVQEVWVVIRHNELWYRNERLRNKKKKYAYITTINWLKRIMTYRESHSKIMHRLWSFVFSISICE